MANDQRDDATEIAVLRAEVDLLRADVARLRAEVARQDMQLDILDRLACRVGGLPDTLQGTFRREVAETLDRKMSFEPVPPGAPRH